jgi:hypothetical protein
MATRVVKLRDTSEPTPEPEANRQRKRPEIGRYLLQVDRQTKGSYETAELAQAAGLTIKTGHPVVQVSVYDSVECLNTLVEVPVAAG